MALSWTTHSLPGLNVSGRSTTLTMILFHSGRRSMSVSNPKTSLAGLDTVAAAVPVPPIPSFLSLGVAGKEAVTEHFVCPGLLLTLRTAERVDWLTDTDADEADLVEHRLPACARQATGNSAGPQVDVAQCLGGHGLAVGDIGELQVPAGSKHTANLTEHRAFVGAEVDDPVRDDDVGPAVLDRHRLQESLAELHVLQAEDVCRRGRLVEHLGGHVDPDDRAIRTDLMGGDERVEAGAGTGVHDSFARFERAKLERVPDAGEGLHRPVGQRIDDRPVVPEARGGNPTGVEVERRVRRRRDAAVLALHLFSKLLCIHRHGLGHDASPLGAAPTITGSPARFHSGNPSSRRRASKPRRRRSRTASSAKTQYGPRQYATSSTSRGSAFKRRSSSLIGTERAPSTWPGS